MKIYAIAKVSFLQIIRQPIFGVLLLLAMGLMTIAPSITGFTMDDDNKMLQDLCLSTILITGLALSAFAASGAISAVMAAYTVWFARNRIKVWYMIWWFPFVRSGVMLVPAAFAMGLWFMEQFLYGLLTLGQPMRGGVGYWVHVGGFVFGLVVAAAVRLFWSGRIPRVRREPGFPGRSYFRPRPVPWYEEDEWEEPW